MKLVTPRPWWRGFLGEIEVKKIPVHAKQEPATDELPGEVTSFEMPQFPSSLDYKVAEAPKGPTQNYRLSIVTKGVVAQQGDKHVITELPIGRWSKPYEVFLDSLVEEKKAKKIISDPLKKRSLRNTWFTSSRYTRKSQAD